MSKHFSNTQEVNKICRRITDKIPALSHNFSNLTLNYLDEQIINYLLDSLLLDETFNHNPRSFHDYSFVTAPAYKALEGFLFQIANDLKLPSSGSGRMIGSFYYDEEKVDKHIDKLLKELEENTQREKGLSTYEKCDVKDRIKEMKGFLQHYRNTPSHYFGEPIDTIEKAHRNIMIIYGAIDNTTQILLKAKLVQIKECVH